MIPQLQRISLPERRVAWIGAFLVFVTCAIYWQVHRHDFVNLDDPDYVTENLQVQSGLTRASVQWAFTHSHASNWQPVTFLSHMLDCQLFGLRPAGHHLVNVLFHAVNTLLLFLLLVRLTRSVGASATVAALFALHPLHVESVAWISERKDVLSTCFGLLVLWCYVNYVQASNASQSRAGVWYVGALFLFGLGLMSKPMLVTWPFVLLLLDYWPLGRIAKFVPGTNAEAPMKPRTLRRLIGEKIPFFALAAGSGIVTLLLQQDDGAVVSDAHLPLSIRLAHVPVSYVIYLAKTFWPVNLASFYPYVVRDWTSLETWGAIVLLTGITVGVLLSFRRHPYLAGGWAWFLGTLFPVIGMVQAGRQDVADRYTYIPHIGLFIALVWLARQLLAERKVSWLPQCGLAVLVIAVCGGLTYRQIPHWKNTRAMAEQAIRATTGNYQAHAQLAAVLIKDREYDAALQQCRLALLYQPTFPETHDIMGLIFTRQGNFEEAIRSYNTAIHHYPRLPRPHEGLAEVYLLQGRFAEAEKEARAALTLAPARFESLAILAWTLQSQNRFDEALELYQQASRLKPGSFAAHRGLGSIHALKGEVAEALREFAAAERLQPTNADVQNSLGMLKLQQGEVMAASNHFSQATTFQPTNALANFQLGNLLGAAQQPIAASHYYRRSLAADPNQPELLNNFAWLLATSWDENTRSGTEAVKLAERACEITQHKVALLLGTLAAAYAESGRFADAVQTAGKAIEIAKAQGLADLAARNEELQARYQKSLPFHEARGPLPVTTESP